METHVQHVRGVEQRPKVPLTTWKKGFRKRKPTFGDHALQVNDVRMVELAHDAGLGQEVPPLFVGVAGLEGLDGHADLPLARHLQAAAADLAELACNHRFTTASRVRRTTA